MKPMMTQLKWRCHRHGNVVSGFLTAIIAGLPAVCQWKYQLPAALKSFSSGGQSEKRKGYQGLRNSNMYYQGLRNMKHILWYGFIKCFRKDTMHCSSHLTAATSISNGFKEGTVLRRIHGFIPLKIQIVT